MTGLFVTGTDTGVGKTHVTSSLARRARSLGQRVFAFKPIETGNGTDHELISEAAGNWQTGELRCLYRFKAPLAPLTAGALEGIEIDLDRVQRVVQASVTKVDLTLVEGVGGWRVPLTMTADVSTLARMLGLPVLIVARAGLGTINHSLLTIEAIERDGVEIAGLVLSRRPDDDRRLAARNFEEIHRRWPHRIVLYEGDDSSLDVFHVEHR